MMIMVIYNKKREEINKKNIMGKMIVKWNWFFIEIMPFHLAHFYPYKTQKNEEKKT